MRRLAGVALVGTVAALALSVAPVPEGLLLLARPGVVCRLVAPPAPVTHLAVVHRAGDLLPAVATLMDVVHELWPPRAASL